MKLPTTSDRFAQPHQAHPTKRAFHYDFEEFNDFAYICLILAKSLGHLFLIRLLTSYDVPLYFILDMRDEFFTKVFKAKAFDLMLSIGRYAPYNGLN